MAKRKSVPTSYLVRVTWHDAHSNESGWKSFEDQAVESEKPCVCDSVGWIVLRSKTAGIVLAQSVNSYGHCIDTITIPPGFIRRVRRLK